jgi:hypothetical protein
MALKAQTRSSADVPGAAGARVRALGVAAGSLMPSANKTNERKSWIARRLESPEREVNAGVPG